MRLIFELLLLTSTVYGTSMHHTLPGSNASAKDIQPGYIFVGEQSVCSCPQNIVYLEYVKYLIQNVIPYGCNGYGIRQFGDNAFNDTNLLSGYYSRDWVVHDIGNWVPYDQRNCTYGEAVTYQSVLINILTLLQSGGRSPVGIFLQGETDTIVDLDVSLSLAKQIAAYNPIVYIWDHSVYGDQTGLFSILTNNRNDRIIKSNPDLVQLINLTKNNVFVDFANIGCGSPTNNGTLPMPSQPAYPAKPGYCSNIVPAYTKETTKISSTRQTTPTTTTRKTTTTSRSFSTTISTRYIPSTTTTRISQRTTTPYRLPTTTTTSYSGPVSNGTCQCVIFAGEMSRYLNANTQKKTFYDAVLLMAAAMPRGIQYGITTYAINIYHHLQCQSYNDFVTAVRQLENKLPSPDGSYTQVGPVLDDIYEHIVTSSPQKVAVMFMGEQEGIRDPNAGHTTCVKIARTQTNFYVLDYTSGTINNNLWPYCTNQKKDGIVNGTNLSANQIYQAFQRTLIADVNNNHC